MTLVEAGGTGGQAAAQHAPKGRHQDKAPVGVVIDGGRLAVGERDQLRLLIGSQDAEHVQGGPGQKVGVMAHTFRVIVAQILEAPEIGHLAGRKK